MDEDVGPLIAAYVEAATDHASQKLRNARAANLAHARLTTSFHQLRALGDSGWLAIRGLTTHESPHVKQWAATHLLQHEPAAACSVLESLSAFPGFVGFEARIVLSEWRAGRLTGA